MSNEKKSFWDSWTKAHDIENEEEILLDHDYDGIQELDNVLPPWWVWGFIATVIISIFYYAMIFQGHYKQEDELKAEIAAFEAEKKAHPELFKENYDLPALTDAAALASGKEIYMTNCAACHVADGGGLVGPNLVDNMWKNGGGMKNVFTTISDGVTNTAMRAWKSGGGALTAKQRQEVSSFVLSLQGTTPANPKAAEGSIVWPK